MKFRDAVRVAPISRSLSGSKTLIQRCERLWQRLRDQSDRADMAYKLISLELAFCCCNVDSKGKSDELDPSLHIIVAVIPDSRS
jgi:hypothetical protein